MRKLKPPHIIILSFLAAILIGTVLLSLPISVHKGNSVPFIDRLFTATSATCVTGLVVKSTASWSEFGKIVIMVLFQAGGLGIMTFSTLFALLLGRKITISENLIMKGTIGRHGLGNLKRLIAYIVGIVLLVETVGAALLFMRWRAIEKWSLMTNIYNSIFHSISAFCNAGFSLFNRSFVGFREDIFINAIMIALIFIGGIGFVVILDLWQLMLRGKDRRPFFARISIQTKIVLTISLVLILAGAAAIFFLEKDNALAGLDTKGKVLSSVFQSVTARTAGFNTLKIGSLATPTLLFLIFLMFIGASPGSTGGGIKTATFGVLIAGTIAMIKNKDRVWMFRKTIARSAIRKAMAIFILGLTWIFVASFILSITEKGHVYGANYYVKILFETVSAFGTVGLSTGITSALSEIGKLIVIITMFVGRIGPLTLALAVALQEEKLLYNYSEEHIMVG
ncbi:MAG: Trk family potassium uptake protein [Candidatus Omnitrophica bacterium]|nr:Trk family potassium uptake protein [Candidatus Omnitrophota bacterium]